MFEPVPEGVTKVIIRLKVIEAALIFKLGYGTNGRRSGLMVCIVYFGSGESG